MANAIAFDTHRFVKNLTASGFTEAQAEALASEHVHLLNSNLATKADLATVATKDDLANLATRNEIANLVTKDEIANLATEAEIANLATKDEIANLATKVETENLAVKAEIANLATKAELATFRGDLRAEVQAVKADLLKWMLTALTAQTALVVALIRFL